MVILIMEVMEVIMAAIIIIITIQEATNWL